MRSSIKSVFQRKYMAFFTIVPLLLTSAVIRVDCPIDGGTGYVSSAPGMEDVSIINIESEWKSAERDMNLCGAYVMYRYDVKLGVVNKGAEDTWGYVSLTLVDLQGDEVVDTQYVVVEAPAGTSLELTYSTWFQSKKDLQLLRSEVRAEVVVEQVPCAISNGTGKVALSTWLFINGLSDTFNELGRQQVYYKPQPVFNPNTEQFN